MLQRKPATLYRAGIRNDTARAGKTIAHRTYRHELADAEFPPQRRQIVLSAIREGTPVRHAAAIVNLSPVAIYGRAQWDTAFRDALDDALDHASKTRMSEYCGTPTGYRSRKCRCRRCRRAHAEETAQYRR